MRFQPTWRAALTVALLVAACGFVATKYGRHAGAEAGALAKVRLQLVWPTLMAMDERDRALIVGLAMSCDLDKQPAVAPEVVACLHRAAEDPHAMLPKGVDQVTAQARLEQLLSGLNAAKHEVLKPKVPSSERS